MAEFNPTPENEVDLERSIIDLKATKSGYVGAKILKEAEATQWKDKLNQPGISQAEYKTAKFERNEVRHKLEAIEVDIRNINLEIAGKRKLLIAVQGHLRGNKQDDKLMGEISALREKYATFAADSSRIASMRRMAAEFALELETIINKQ